MSWRTYSIALLAITLGAWGLRLGVTEKFVGLDSPPAAEDGLDQLDYELFAWRMACGEGYTLEDGTASARRAPGTSLIIAPVYLLFGRSYLAARLWMTFLSAATCLAVAWVVRRSCGQTAALLAALGVALDPGLFYYSIHLWSEAPFCLFLTLAIGCTVRTWHDERWAHRMAGGLCWGIALLIRPQVVFALPFVALAVLWASPVRRKLIFETAAALGVAGIVAAPWVVRNAMVLGKPTLATVVGGYTFWGAHNQRTFHEPQFRGLWLPPSEIADRSELRAINELEQDAVTWQLGWRSVRENAWSVPRLLAWKVYRLVTPFEETPNRAVYWAFALSWIVLAPLAAVGIIELSRRDPILFRLIAVQIAATLLCTLLFYGAARFRHGIDPLLLMAAGVGATVLVHRRHAGSLQFLFRMVRPREVPVAPRGGLNRGTARRDFPARGKPDQKISGETG